MALHVVMAGSDYECAVRLSVEPTQLCERPGEGEAVLRHLARFCPTAGGTELQGH